jgi:hypothetical protein
MFQLPKYYDPVIQIGAMKSRYPQFKIDRRGQYDMLFTGELKVRPQFPLYSVTIHYQGRIRPLVRIIEPALVESPPHFFKETNSLCLYHPQNYHWTSEKLVAKDIVSWTAAWIYFYEVWLQKGQWYGPEADHYELIKSELN